MRKKLDVLHETIAHRGGWHLSLVGYLYKRSGTLFWGE